MASDDPTQSTPQYSYLHSNVQSWDTEPVNRHLAEMARQGWELVSGNCIQARQFDNAAGQYVPVMRHNFYWRRLAGS